MHHYIKETYLDFSLVWTLLKTLGLMKIGLNLWDINLQVEINNLEPWESFIGFNWLTQELWMKHIASKSRDLQKPRTGMKSVLETFFATSLLRAGPLTGVVLLESLHEKPLMYMIVFQLLVSPHAFPWNLTWNSQKMLFVYESQLPTQQEYFFVFFILLA